MPGMMKKPAAKKPMSYQKGGMVKKSGAKPMHRMPDGKMMPGAMHGSAKAKK